MLFGPAGTPIPPGMITVGPSSLILFAGINTEALVLRDDDSYNPCPIFGKFSLGSY